MIDHECSGARYAGAAVRASTSGATCRVTYSWSNRSTSPELLVLTISARQGGPHAESRCNTSPGVCACAGNGEHRETVSNVWACFRIMSNRSARETVGSGTGYWDWAPHGLPDRFFAVKDPRVAQGRPADENAVHPAGQDAGDGFRSRSRCRRCPTRGCPVGGFEPQASAIASQSASPRYICFRVRPWMDMTCGRPLGQTRAPFIDDDGVIPQARLHR